MSADLHLDRIRETRDRAEQAEREHQRALAAYWQAIHDAYRALGATELARQLGVSRANIYKLLQKAGRTEG